MQIIDAEPETLVINCFGCKRGLTVSMAPVVVTEDDGQEYMILPCPNAPHVCNTCRQKPAVMKAARIELEENHWNVVGHAESRKVKLANNG